LAVDGDEADPLVLPQQRYAYVGAYSTPLYIHNRKRIAVEVTLRFGEIFYLDGTAGPENATGQRFGTRAERSALQVPDKVRVGAELRHQLERAPVVLKHEAEIGCAKAPRIAEKVLENRLQLARRRTDDTQHF